MLCRLQYKLVWIFYKSEKYEASNTIECMYDYYLLNFCNCMTIVRILTVCK